MELFKSRDLYPEYYDSRKIDTRSLTDKLLYELRYAKLRSATEAEVERRAFMAGRWGVWRNKCPYRKGAGLREWWLHAWQRGRDEYEKNKTKPKPPSGPNGGRRIPKIA